MQIIVKHLGVNLCVRIYSNSQHLLTCYDAMMMMITIILIIINQIKCIAGRVVHTLVRIIMYILARFQLCRRQVAAAAHYNFAQIEKQKTMLREMKFSRSKETSSWCAGEAIFCLKKVNARKISKPKRPMQARTRC